ncbi:MAG TPA: ribosome rescue GTPase HflX [Gammaproteobacteria bacterium]
MELFERPGYGERAILVNVDFGSGGAGQLQEFEELALSAGTRPVAAVSASRTAPHPRFYVGTGKAEEIQAVAKLHQAEVVLFNHELSASQERNLEKLLQCRVLDRPGLILDIFAQRARSFEGKLQVELAQLKHLSTRLVRGWTHLERQKGGIGLRGPGETQLETDRRLIGRRIIQLQKRLEKVNQQRHQSRRARTRAEVPTVSLVGYTNAGKSTLFNRLTDAGVYVQDQMFATLDPTLRRISLPGTGAMVLADTVGFVRDLPHDLIAAFRSTLQETREAELLLHVVDAHDEERLFRIEQVNQVLAQIDAADVPQVIVYNKIDLNGLEPSLTRDAGGNVISVAVSAVTGAGMGLLFEVLAEFFRDRDYRGWIKLSPGEGRQRSMLYEHGQVLDDQGDGDGGWLLRVRISGEQLRRLGIPVDRINQEYRNSEAATVAGAA